MNSMPGDPSASDLGIPSGQNAAGASGSGSTPAPAAPESEFSGNMFSGHGASSQDTGSGQNGGGRVGTNGTGNMGNMAAPEPGRETYKGGSNGQTQGPGTSPERRENVSRDDRKNLGSGQKPGTETREKADGTGRKSGGRAGTSSMNNMAAPDPDRADYKQENQERTGARGGRKDLTTPPGSKKENGGQKGDKK